jgi:large subunit ribosomal protein L30
VPKLLITLKRSPIGNRQRHKDTVRSLGLRRIGQTVEKEDNPSVRGMVTAVRHLVEVRTVSDAETGAIDERG